MKGRTLAFLRGDAAEARRNERDSGLARASTRRTNFGLVSFGAPSTRQRQSCDPKQHCNEKENPHVLIFPLAVELLSL